MTTQAKKQYKCSLQFKLSIIFLIIIFIMLAVGVVGYFGLNKLTATTNHIVKERLPTLKSVENALLAASAAGLYVEKKLSHHRDITQDTQQDSDLDKSKKIFDMYVAALTWGSESKAFALSADGTNASEWEKAGLKNEFKVKQASDIEIQMAGRASLYFSGFYNNALKAVSLHNKGLKLEEEGKSKEGKLSHVESEKYAIKAREYTELTQASLSDIVKFSEIEIKRETEEIQKIHSNTLRMMLVIGIISIIIILMVGILSTNLFIVKPLIYLEGIINKFSLGDLTKRSKLKSNDEIGNLSLVFNKMAKQLLEYQKKLEQKVTVRTGDLNIANKTLEQREIAMLNLLEDARGLQEALEKEKASVEQKVVERSRELSMEHSRLLSLLEGVRLGVVMVDLNFNVVMANGAAKMLLGRKENSSLNYRQIQAKLKHIDLSHTLSYYVREKKTINIQEARIGNKFYRIFMSAVRDRGAQTFIGAVMIFEDITEERMVDQLRTEIVAITSHQLRTPLSVIKGNLEMVLGGDMGEIKPEQRKMLTEVFFGNERMIKLVNDLTDVSKITEGSLGLTPRPTKVDKLINDIILQLKAVAEKENVSIIFENLAGPVSSIYLDVQRFSQVLQNLIDNAIKYGHKGKEGKVLIRLEKEKDGSITISIKDDGVGIPKDEQIKIFERFFRASNASKLSPGGGTGLGLFIAKAIVEQHKGRIWFESEQNKGTTFYVNLPVYKRVLKKGKPKRLATLKPVSKKIQRPIVKKTPPKKLNTN